MLILSNRIVVGKLCVRRFRDLDLVKEFRIKFGKMSENILVIFMALHRRLRLLVAGGVIGCRVRLLQECCISSSSRLLLGR